jgi:hypothetical protein
MAATDRAKCVEVLDIGLHRSDRCGEASVRDLRAAALNEHALLTDVQQRLHGRAADMA